MNKETFVGVTLSVLPRQWTAYNSFHYVIWRINIFFVERSKTWLHGTDQGPNTPPGFHVVESSNTVLVMTFSPTKYMAHLYRGELPGLGPLTINLKIDAKTSGIDVNNIIT